MSILTNAHEQITREFRRARDSSLAQNAGWMLVGQGTNLILQAAYFMILGRLLGSSQYGIYIGAFALTNLISTYSAMGAGTIFLRYVSSNREMFSVYWGNILLMMGCVSGLLITGTVIAAPHILNSSSASLVPMAAVANCLCGELTANVARIFQAFERMKITASLNSVISVVRLVTAAGMMLSLHRATAFQWTEASLLISFLATLVSLIVVTYYFGWPTFSLRLMLRSIPEGFGYCFGQSTAGVYNDIDKTMLSHYGLNAANGVYALAYRVIDMATTPLIAVRDAAVPRFFLIGTTGGHAARQLSFRLMKRTAAVSVLMSAALFLFAPFIPRLVGNSFAESALAVRWLCLIPVLRCAHQISGSAIMGLGKHNFRLFNQILVAVLNFSLNLWCIPTFGWRGAAWTSLLSDGLLGGLNLIVFLILTRNHGAMPMTGPQSA